MTTSTRLALGDVRGLLNDLNDKLASEDGSDVWKPALAKFLRKENPWPQESVVVTPRWREEDGVIHFSLISDGTTGPQWIDRLEVHGITCRQLLRSEDFCPTCDVLYNIAILKGECVAHKNRNPTKLQLEGTLRGFKHRRDVNPEIACLICDAFSDNDINAMGLRWITVMHNPIKDLNGMSCLFDIETGALGGLGISPSLSNPYFTFSPATGFAFVVSQIDPDRPEA